MRATWKPLLFAALLLGLVLNACQIISGLDTVPLIPDGLDASTGKKDAGKKKTDGGQLDGGENPDDSTPTGACVVIGATGCPAAPCCLPGDLEASTETVLCAKNTCTRCRLPGQRAEGRECCSGQPAVDGVCQGKCQEGGSNCNGSDLFCCGPKEPKTLSVCKSDVCGSCKKDGLDCETSDECCGANGFYCKSDKKCNQCTQLNGACSRTSDCCVTTGSGAQPVVCRSDKTAAAVRGTCGCVSKGEPCGFKEDCCANDKCNTQGTCGCIGTLGACGADSDCCRIGIPPLTAEQPCVKGPGAATGSCGCKTGKGSPCSKDNDCCLQNGTNRCNGKKKCGCQAPNDECEGNGDCCDGAGDYCNTKTKLCKRSGLNEGCKKNEDCAPSDLNCNVGEEKCCLKPGKSTMNVNECCSKMYADADGGTICK
jgi:hypothetical protein